MTTRLAMSAAAKLGLDPTKARPHVLMLFAQLLDSESQYIFTLNHEDNRRIAPGIGRGLLDRDAFIAAGMGIGLLPVPVRGGQEYFTAAAPEFWPDPGVFAEAAAAPGVLSESEALESVYWGDHSLKTNTGIRLDKNPNLLFRTVHTTQAGADTNNEFHDFIKPIGASVRFGGGDENEITVRINCPDKTLIGGPADRNNYLMILLDGAIVKGATEKARLSS
ncbi:MAG: hypothetical protein AAFZ52_11180 [Bacteroidota bacterium]